jgi:hypothetical protein
MSRPIQVKPADSESRTGNKFIGSFFISIYQTDRLFIG